jgi:hypothetical protein
MNKDLFIKIISELPKQFDSHKFIRAMLKKYSREYGQLLVDYGNVRVVNSQIAQFIADNSNEFKVKALDPRFKSVDLFLNNVPNTLWEKVQ